MEILMSMEFVSRCGLTMITILVIGTISNVTTYYPTSAKAEHLQVNIFKNVSCHFSEEFDKLFYTAVQQPCRIFIQNSCWNEMKKMDFLKTINLLQKIPNLPLLKNVMVNIQTSTNSKTVATNGWLTRLHGLKRSKFAKKWTDLIWYRFCPSPRRPWPWYLLQTMLLQHGLASLTQAIQDCTNGQMVGPCRSPTGDSHLYLVKLFLLVSLKTSRMENGTNFKISNDYPDQCKVKNEFFSLSFQKNLKCSLSQNHTQFLLGYVW